MTRPRSRLAPRTYHEVSDLVSQAVAYGIRRSFKHTDTPGEETLQHEIENAVMGVLADVILWPRVRR